jgi:hypothetical protein
MSDLEPGVSRPRAPGGPIAAGTPGNAKATPIPVPLERVHDFRLWHETDLPT